MLVVAARHHDCGKARAIWQQYAGNPGFVRDPETHPPLAKFVTRGDPNRLRIGEANYRHEFGSVRDAIEMKAFNQLPSPLRDLGLHLIAAHHGNGRPMIVAYDEKDLAGNESIKLADQLRANITTLTSDWGLWGLAWWEALLRAADVAASRENPNQESAR
jgi:CRISPR-associated endonuclease/helicase Cas3